MDKIKASENSTEKSLDKWIKKYPGSYDISDKLDGISCLLTMENDKVKLYTRGDGTYGQDITHLLEYIDINTKNWMV